MSNPPVQPMARLECDHYQRVTVKAAREFEWQRCLTCGGFSRPRVVLIREWHAFCSSCSWERWVGQMKASAEKAKHWHISHGKFAHVVRLEYATVPGMEYDKSINPGGSAAPITEDNDHDSEQPHLL